MNGGLVPPFFLKGLIMKVSSLLLIVVGIFLCGCAKDGLQTTASQDKSWHATKEARQAELALYLQQNQEAYRWFADFPLGVNDGVPYIITKLLPKLAPEFWGSDENFLEVIGLFNDERIPGYPIARGMGWSGLGREDNKNAVDYASFTCGACHIGRVKTEQGMSYLDGGINAQFNLPQYRVRAFNTLNKIAAAGKNDAEKIALITNKIITALDKVHSEDKTYFYNNYRLGNKVFDADYEATQIALFKEQADELVKKFIVRTNLEYKAFEVLLDKNYRGFEQQMLAGFGGMADATGISTSFAYVVDRDLNHAVVNLNSLPPSQGITDFMAVWQQEKRKSQWSSDHKRLINGGGQWNGNIPISIFRNLAAELTMGFGAETDLRVAAFAEILLDGLPAPVYPFEVDIQKANIGRVLYEQHCLACHKPHNGEVYKVGTDSGRAHVANEVITASGRKGFTGICTPTTVVSLPGYGNIKPCAEFEGVSLVGKSEFAMLDPKSHDGYNALPLGGVWAQAPYLHNGSVPTLYHLLVPSERPRVFVKSRLDYDQQLVGFAWQLPTDKAQVSKDGYLYDTQAIPAFSNGGHDQNITIGQAHYQLDWSNDKPGAMAIIEYMKTL